MKRKLTSVQKTIQAIVRIQKKQMQPLVECMPDKARTPEQRKLSKAHGTPKQFAQGCLNAIGEISMMEADLAAKKYLWQWNSAGREIQHPRKPKSDYERFSGLPYKTYPEDFKGGVLVFACVRRYRGRGKLRLMLHEATPMSRKGFAYGNGKCWHVALDDLKTHQDQKPSR